MSHITFVGLLCVMIVAVLAPLLIQATRLYLLSAVVLEIIIGVIIGPSILGWVQVDTVLQIFSLLGLNYLLFLAGLEVDLQLLRGRPLRQASIGFLVSCVLSLLVSLALSAFGLVSSPFFVAILLVATGLGIVLPVLKDAGELGSQFGLFVIAGATLAEFGSIVLLTLFFSEDEAGFLPRLILLGTFALFAALIAVAVLLLYRTVWLGATIRRLQDTTAQLSVRGTLLVLIAFSVLAYNFGVEEILGTFLAGVLIGLLARTGQGEHSGHSPFLMKLEAIGFGFFVPIFFVTSGLRFDLQALLASPSSLLLVPVFLIALLLIHGLPLPFLRSGLSRRQLTGAALLEATSLSFLVAGVQIGTQLHVISAAIGASLIAAGLLSVVLYPLLALVLLRQKVTTTDEVTTGYVAEVDE